MEFNTYEKWLSKVDAKIHQLCGMTTKDFENFEYLKAYKRGDSPGQAAIAAMRKDHWA